MYGKTRCLDCYEEYLKGGVHQCAIDPLRKRELEARKRELEALKEHIYHGRDPATAPTPDNVNRPKHYAGGKVECIDAIEVAVDGLVGIEAACTANAIKYLWRWKKKGGLEDLRKARWYINRLLGEK